MSSSSISSESVSSRPRCVGWSQLSNPTHTPQQGSRSERVPAGEVVPRGGTRPVPARRVDPGDGEARVSPEKAGGGARSPDGRAESRPNTMSSRVSRVGWSQLSNPTHTPQQGLRSKRVPAREVAPHGGNRSVPARRMDLGGAEPRVPPEKVGGGARSSYERVESCASDLGSMMESALVIPVKREVASHGGTMSVPVRRMDFEGGGPRVSSEKVGGGARSPDGRVENRAFDLCPVQDSAPVIRLKRSLLEENRERRMRACSGQQHVVPRPGMVLLKSFLSLRDQVTLIRECQRLGVGPGGFYQPGYRDGAKLRLQMMCLGMNWDPETKEYHDIRSYDDSKPPLIPQPFKKMVESAMQASRDLIRRSYEGRAEYELPNFSPDLCIVNFYSNTGKLGIHQDQDESKESLRKGLPVVSFSVGDSADFQYGDDREATNTVKLESGDVLIFGGKSRNIFHGVSKIYPQSAPSTLIEETKLRPGRLNLTFRQY